MHQTKQAAPPFSMVGVWVVDARAIHSPRFVVFDESMTVREALREIEGREAGQVFISAHTPDIASLDVMNMYIREFNSHHGIITIGGRSSMSEARLIFLAAERFNLYHQHALEVARNSGWRGRAVYQIVERS